MIGRDYLLNVFQIYIKKLSILQNIILLFAAKKNFHHLRSLVIPASRKTNWNWILKDTFARMLFLAIEISVIREQNPSRPASFDDIFKFKKVAYKINQITFTRTLLPFLSLSLTSPFLSHSREVNICFEGRYGKIFFMNPHFDVLLFLCYLLVHIQQQQQQRHHTCAIYSNTRQ